MASGDRRPELQLEAHASQWSKAHWWPLLRKWRIRKDSQLAPQGRSWSLALSERSEKNCTQQVESCRVCHYTRHDRTTIDTKKSTSPAKDGKLGHFHALQHTERRRRWVSTHRDTVQVVNFRSEVEKKPQLFKNQFISQACKQGCHPMGHLQKSGLP